jgi:tetratricopeptide (TPR) repeat protein
MLDDFISNTSLTAFLDRLGIYGDGERAGILAGVVFICLALCVWRWRVGRRRRRRLIALTKENKALEAELASQHYVVTGHEVRLAGLTEALERLNVQVPERQLDLADKERSEGSDERAIRILEDLFPHVALATARSAIELGRYELSLTVDEREVSHLQRAERYAQIAVALDGEDREAHDILAEVRRRRDAIDPDTTDAERGAARNLALAYAGGVHGQAGPSMIAQIRERGRDLQRQGYNQSAAAVLRRAVVLSERLFDPDAAEILQARTDLAVVLSAISHHGEAEELLRDVLAVQERLLGHDNPDTLVIQHHLAATLLRQRRFREAEAIWRIVLAARERVLGEQDAETLRTRHHLALAIGSQGRHSEAESLLQQVVAVRKRQQGPNHAETVAAKHNLARAISAQGRHGEAESLLRDVVALRERFLGRNHGETVTARNDLADAVAAQQRGAEADAIRSLAPVDAHAAGVGAAVGL